MIKTTILLIMLSAFVGAAIGGILVALITRKNEE